jgi:hypothetical protein
MTEGAIGLCKILKGSSYQNEPFSDWGIMTANFGGLSNIVPKNLFSR